jgi:outer membrane protein assembly factor BamB
VIATGKIGIVYEFDQATGALLWKTPVGTHNGHDNDDLYAMNGQTDKLPALPVQVYPGLLGGEPAPGAVDGDTIYVAANEYPVTWADQQTPQFGDPSTATGEIIALDLVTGRIKWQHKLAASPYGGTTVANDLVFTTTLDGTVMALNTRTGDLAWQAALPAETVGGVAIDGDTLLTAAGWPQNTSQTAEFVAYRLTTH